MSEDKTTYKADPEAAAVLSEAVLDIKTKGYGEVTAIIRGGKITRIVKTEETKLD